MDLDTGIRELPVSSPPWAMENLPPFPGVATRLLHVLSQEDANINEIAEVVAAEPVFATRVLELANSPLFAIRQPVRTIPQAIHLLGLARVRAITVTRAISDFVAPAINLKTLRVCWQNSLAGAVLAEKLARACRMDADFAYVAGLVRDIGRLALLIKYPREYENLVTVSVREPSRSHVDGTRVVRRRPWQGRRVAHSENADTTGVRRSDRAPSSQAAA